MRKRTKARECTLKILYQAEIKDREISLCTKDFFEEHPSKDPTIVDFSKILTAGVEKHLEAIDNKITEYATNWQIKRMAIIDRNVLRLGVFELVHLDDVPPKVSINEAVELAKKYGDVDSGKFINGILDKIHKQEIIKQEETS